MHNPGKLNNQPQVSNRNGLTVPVFIYLVFYTLILALAAGSFIIFRPIVYVDSTKAKIYCADGKEYGANAVFIFSLNGGLDEFNDKKARKLCEYGTIFDYQDAFAIPAKINYRFDPVFYQESSYPEAGLGFILTFTIGAFIIETVSFIFFKLTGVKQVKSKRFNLGVFVINIFDVIIGLNYEK